MTKAEKAARRECGFVLEAALDCDGFKHRELPDGVEDDEFFAAVEALVKELKGKKP